MVRFSGRRPGRIRHKNVIHDGLHEPIIPQELWNAVQEKLAQQTTTSKCARKSRDVNILKGLLYDCEGTIYSPSHTNKKGKRYRYYVSQNLLQYQDHPKGIIARIPAHEVETAVEEGIRSYLQDEGKAARLLNLDISRDHVVVRHISENQNDIPARDLIGIIQRIVVDADTLVINLDVPALRKLISNRLRLDLPPDDKRDTVRIKAPYEVRKSYLGTVVIESKNGNEDLFDRLHPNELKNLVRGVMWRDEHFRGATLREIADREGLSENWIGNLIRQSFETLSA